MNTADTLDSILSHPPSASLFAKAVERLDELPIRERREALERAAFGMESWPDHTRRAPAAAWRRIQQGSAPPPWWGLVRTVHVREGDTLEVGPALAPLTVVDASRVNVDPSPLREARGLRSLDLSANDAVDSLDFLTETPRVERLALSGLELFPELSPVRELPALHTLDLSFNPNLDDLAPIASLEALRWLDLSGCERLEDFAPLATLAGLETLALDGCVGLRNLAFLDQLHRLRRLSARRLPLLVDLLPLAASKLEHLYLGGPRLVTGAPLGNLASLVELALSDAPRLVDLSFLPQLEKLLVLQVDGVPARLPALTGPTLEELLIADCPEVRDLEPLAGLDALERLTLRDLPLEDLAPLAGLRKLERLSLTRCPRIRDLSPLRRLPLRQLELVGADPGLDMSELPAGCKVVG